MKGIKNGMGAYEGIANGKTYSIQDDSAALLAAPWLEKDSDCLVDKILAEKDFWGADLQQLNGFSNAVKKHLRSLMKNGALETIQQVQLNKTVAG
jgi:tagaturonate reductase